MERVIHTELLIIGAGPVGLAAMAEAKSRQLDFIIIDPQKPSARQKVMINQYRISVAKLRARTVRQRPDGTFLIICNRNTSILAKYVFVTTSLHPRHPSMRNFDKFFGKNIFFFADVNRRDLQGKRIGVLSGRDSGAAAALYLQQRGNTVFLFEKQTTLPVKDRYQRRLLRASVKVLTDVCQIEIVDNKSDFSGVAIIQHVRWGTREGIIPLDYLFVCAGMAPVVELLAKLPLVYDDSGNILVNPETMETSIANLYVDKELA